MLVRNDAKYRSILRGSHHTLTCLLSFKTNIPSHSKNMTKQFYEDLVLWSILSPGQVNRVKPKRTPWQRFLDDLSQLCDTQPGGRTVVSIAVSQKGPSQVYWITTSGSFTKAVNLLRELLYTMHHARSVLNLSQRQTGAKILTVATAKCRPKARNYIRQLRSRLDAAAECQYVNHGTELVPLLQLLCLTLPKTLPS